MGGKSTVVKEGPNAMELHRLYQRHAPEIARIARAKGDLAAAEECEKMCGYLPQASTVRKIREKDNERRGIKDDKTLSVNKLFLHPNGASYFDSLVAAFKRIIIKDEIALLALEKEMTECIARKDEEIGQLKEEIAKLTSRPREEDTLMELEELLKE